MSDSDGPKISFAEIKVGRTYDRHELAEQWNYQSYQALGRGVVTPRDNDLVVLFITEERGIDKLEDGVLRMTGEKGHVADHRLAGSQVNGDHVHLFYREAHRSKFTYYGEVELIDCILRTETQSTFWFGMPEFFERVGEDIRTEADTYGTDSEEWESDPEGMKKTVETVRYERSRRNRQRALARHGNTCCVCEFNFDAFYGADLARGYIEIHHTRSVTELDGETPNIETDLVPICSNCHSMAHRRRDEIVSIEELKRHISIVSR